MAAVTTLELAQLSLLRNLTVENGGMAALTEIVLKEFPSLTTVAVKGRFAALKRFELDRLV